MDWKEALKAILDESLKRRGDLVLIGIGSPLRGDDGVGVRIANMLRKVVKHDRVKVLVLEDRVDLLPKALKKLNPAVLLFFDAADFGGRPGEIILMSLPESSGKTISTHEIPLELIIKVSGVRSPVYVIGVQVMSLEFGGDLSPAIKAAGDEIVGFLQEILSSNL